MELYDYVKSQIIYDLKEAYTCSRGKFITVVIDGWKSKTSCSKFVGKKHATIGAAVYSTQSGVRIYYISHRSRMQTRLLSVKQFEPTLVERSRFELSNIYKIWVSSILKGFGIDEFVFAGAYVSKTILYVFAQPCR